MTGDDEPSLIGHASCESSFFARKSVPAKGAGRGGEVAVVLAEANSIAEILKRMVHHKQSTLRRLENLTHTNRMDSLP